MINNPKTVSREKWLAARKVGAWRAYHKALLEAGILVGGNALQSPETATTVRLKEGKRRVQALSARAVASPSRERLAAYAY